MGRQMEIPLVSFNISLTTGEGLLLFRKCAFCSSIRQVAMWYQETASLRVQAPFRSFKQSPEFAFSFWDSVLFFCWNIQEGQGNSLGTIYTSHMKQFLNRRIPSGTYEMGVGAYMASIPQ